MSTIKDPQRLAAFLEQWSLLEEPLNLRRLTTRGIIVSSEDFLLHLPHFRHLENLALKLDPSPSSPLELGKIFSILCREEIFLKHVSLTMLHSPGIIDYISSYTGLEGFSINSYDTRDDVPILIHRFFSALKHHYGSLKSLRLDIDRISPWQEVSRTHLSESAETFRSLEILDHRVYLSLEDVHANNPEPLVRVLLNLFQN
jgi:hypothetical protein